MNIYEEIASSCACINMDLQSYQEENDSEQKKIIMERIVSNNSRSMQMAKLLCSKANDIYTILKEIYPVNLGEGVQSYLQGVEDGKKETA